MIWHRKKRRQNLVILGNCSVKLIVFSIFSQNCLIENNSTDGPLFSRLSLTSPVARPRLTSRCKTSRGIAQTPQPGPQADRLGNSLVYCPLLPEEGAEDILKSLASVCGAGCHKSLAEVFFSFRQLNHFSFIITR